MLAKIRKAMKEFLSQEGSLHRSSLSYSFLLAIFPALIVIIILFQNELLDIERVSTFMYHYLPQDIMEPFIEYILDADYSNIYTVIVTLGTTIFLASRSFYTFMLISANKEKFVTRSFIIRIKAILLFLGFIISIGLMGLFAHLFPFYESIHLVIMIFIVFYLFYRMLSFEVRPIQYGLVGAVFTTIGVVCIGALFLTIVQTVSRYQTLYGPLASILIMMLSIHVISGTIYFGYCLNHAYDFHYKEHQFKNKHMYDKLEQYYQKVRSLVKR